MEDKLLSVKEASKFLGISPVHLRKLLFEGKIHFVNLAHGKIRRSIRIEKQALEDFVKQGGV